MISYSKQRTICDSVRETIKHVIVTSDDPGVKAKVYQIPTTESVLRAVSILPVMDTEEKLRDFIIEHVLGSLRLTKIQKEYFRSDGLG